jgi:hypothetical protein
MSIDVGPDRGECGIGRWPGRGRREEGAQEGRATPGSGASRVTNRAADPEPRMNIDLNWNMEISP